MFDQGDDRTPEGEVHTFIRGEFGGGFDCRSVSNDELVEGELIDDLMVVLRQVLDVFLGIIFVDLNFHAILVDFRNAFRFLDPMDVNRWRFDQ